MKEEDLAEYGLHDIYENRIDSYEFAHAAREQCKGTTMFTDLDGVYRMEANVQAAYVELSRSPLNISVSKIDVPLDFTIMIRTLEQTRYFRTGVVWITKPQWKRHVEDKIEKYMLVSEFYPGQACPNCRGPENTALYTVEDDERKCISCGRIVPGVTPA